MKRIIKRTLVTVVLTSASLLFSRYFLGKVDRKVVGEIKKYREQKPPFVRVYKSHQKLIKKATSGLPIFVFSVFLYGYGKFHHNRASIIGRDLMLGFLIAGGISRFFKHSVGRARPRITYDFVFKPITLKKGYDSFPSGHTTVAVCFARIMMGHFPELSPLFISYGALTAFDRLFGVSHFPSDVLTGVMIGISIGNAIVE